MALPSDVSLQPSTTDRGEHLCFPKHMVGLAELLCDLDAEQQIGDARTRHHGCVVDGIPNLSSDYDERNQRHMRGWKRRSLILGCDDFVLIRVHNQHKRLQVYMG